MQDLRQGLVSGVISGVLTAVVLLLVTQYWIKVVRPWLENLVYKGVRLDGIWKASMEVKGQVKSESIVLKQRAHRITGIITYPEDTKGSSHTYALEGWFYDNTLTAVTEELGRARSDRGAVVMAFRPGLSIGTLEGIGVWFEGTKPVATSYIWTREPHQ